MKLAVPVSVCALVTERDIWPLALQNRPEP